MSRVAFGLLWFTLTVQASRLLLNGLVWHQSPGLDVIGAIIALTVAGYAVGYRSGWSAVAVRVVMAADFLFAVADRFGILGPAGSPGVSWGDFGHFIAYTQTVAVFVPAGLAPILAVLATIAEITLGLALLVGFQLRRTALASAVLLGTYGICMTTSLPLAEQFHYNVFVLATAMLALAITHAPTPTLDQLLACGLGVVHQPADDAAGRGHPAARADRDGAGSGTGPC